MAVFYIKGGTYGFDKMKVMKTTLSVVMITHNSDELLEQSLRSVEPIADEIIIVDGGSTDRTISIAQSLNATVLKNNDDRLGIRKKMGISHARGPWILILDSDEIVSPLLAEEIRGIKTSRSPIDVYYIPFQNHYLGKPLRYGGERYAMPRLFKKGKATMSDALVHEQIMFDIGSSTCMHSPIQHYSYRSLVQMYKKFTGYALREARQKRAAGESTSLKKIILYPLHMVWARFIEDRGYKDGLFRLPLDVGFGYMELLTYASMVFIR